MSKRPLSIVVADDHPVVRRGLAEVLRSCPLIQVIATHADGSSALHAIRTLQPDIALLDIAMPGLSGIDILAGLVAHKNGAKVILLTASISDAEILAAIAHGAKAILFKDAAPDDLVECIRVVARGGTWFPDELVEAAVQRETGKDPGKCMELTQTLTAREREIMLLVATGLSNKAVARQLAISEGTIKIHLHNIFRKTGVSNRTALAAASLPNQKQDLIHRTMPAAAAVPKVQGSK